MIALHLLTYALFRLFGGAISLLPHRLLYLFGLMAGRAIYHLHREFRKKTYTNLAIAFPDLSHAQSKKIAIASFQNLTITCLEFFWLKGHERNLLEQVDVETTEEVLERLKNKKSVVFMTAHQANWEIPFLVASLYGSGVGIGRPIKNRWIYNYVLSIREKNGSRIIMPKNAVREGVRALVAGQFVGIVGDQALPKSNYHYPLFGMRAWATTMPALLAYKTNSPLVLATTIRQKSTYKLISSEPIWPDLNRTAKEEVVRMMDLAMQHLQRTIEEHPSDWLWQHDRWKQPGADHVKRPYRFAQILIILPPNLTPYLPIIGLLRHIYPKAFLTFMVKQDALINLQSEPDTTFLPYDKECDLMIENYRYQLVLDFYDSKKVRRYYKRLSAIKVLSLNEMKKISRSSELSQIIINTLCKNDICQKIATFSMNS